MLIQIFRAGRHTDSKGNTRDWSRSDLDRIASTYNPAEHEAPVVIGHPKTNDPAYGWVEGLRRDGDVLVAKVGQLVPQFVDAVKQGLYKKVSMSLYPDGTFRHLGFLGAVPPAVKGLAPVAFNGGEEGPTFEEDYRLNTVGMVVQNLRDWLIEKFDLETADRLIPSWAVNDINRPPEPRTAFAEESPEQKAQAGRATKYKIAAKEGGNVTKPAEFESLDDSEFGDPVNYRYPIDAEHVQAALSYWAKETNRSAYTPEEVTVITKRILAAAKANDVEVDETKFEFNQQPNIGGDMEEITRLKQQIAALTQQVSTFSEADQAKNAELAGLKAQLAAREKAERTASFTAFCEPLAKAGRMVPAQRPAAMAIMETLAGAAEVEFAEGDKTVKKSPLDAFKDLLAALPVQVEFAETATKGKAGAGSGAGSDFVAPEGAAVDQASLDLRNQAKALAKEKGISFSEAAAQLSLEQSRK